MPITPALVMQSIVMPICSVRRFHFDCVIVSILLFFFYATYLGYLKVAVLSQFFSN